MAYTKADRDGLTPPSRPTKQEIQLKTELSTFVHDDQLVSVDGLNFQEFAKDAAQYYDNPSKFRQIITGWLTRSKLKRSTEGVRLYTEYLDELRLASKSASDLQEQLLKDKIIHAFQTEIALQRLREEWQVEKNSFKYRNAVIEADTAKQNFFTRFYNEANPKDISETTIILLSMFNPRSQNSSSMFSLDGSSSSSSVQYGTPEGIMQINQQEKLIEMFIKENIEDLKKKRAEVRVIDAQATKEEALAEKEKAQADLSRHTTDTTINEDKAR